MNSVGANQYPRSGSSHSIVAARPLLLPGRDEHLDPLELLGRVDRADVGVLVERIADPQPPHPLPQFRDHLVVHALLDSSREPAQHTWPWLKKMPLTIPSTAWSSAASSNTMFADLPPSSSVSATSAPGQRGLDVPADRGRSGEGDLVDFFERTRAAPISPSPGRMEIDSRRELGLLGDLGEQQRGQRRGLGRLEDRRVPAGQRGRELPRRHQQREIPRHDLADHAERCDLARGVGGNRRSQACRPIPRNRRSVRRPGGCPRPGTLERLAAVHRLDDRELA